MMEYLLSLWKIMQRLGMVGVFVAFFPGVAVVHAGSGSGLDCKDVKQLVDTIPRLHFSIHEFTNDMSTRTLANLLKAWDPGKNFFLQEDIDLFNQKFAATLPGMIAKADCSAIDLIFSQYSKRFDERQALVPKLIAMEHNFKIDEYLELERKTLPFAKTTSELDERWRKKIKFQFMQLLATINDPKKVREKLEKRYSLAAKRQKELTTDNVYGMFIDAYATSFDPHSDYYSKDQLAEFRVATSLSLEGIGALLRSEDGVTTIQSLVPGGAAQKSGLVKVDDKIVGVGQGSGQAVDVIDMNLPDVVKLIRGQLGTEVRLTLRRDGKEFIAPIVRDKVQLEDRAAKSKIYNVRADDVKSSQTYKVGVIDLPSFYMDFEGRQANRENFRSSSRDVREELEKLKKENVNAVVLDLRLNGGGSLDEAINISGLFNGKGPVVQIRGTNTKPFVSRYEGDAVYSGPLLVLIDRQSASASEILAGAVQDYGRGLIVGDSHTFGKGTVQNLSDLDERLGAIKITISKFYRPSGASTQLRGVASDITFPSIADHYEIGEKYYDYALEWDQVPSSTFTDFSMTKPSVPALQLASAGRIKSDKGFQDIKDAIEKYEKNKLERSRVSLKEKSKEEKEKEAKELKEYEEKEKKSPKDNFGNPIPQLKDDPTLQESLLIAGDYVRTLQKAKLVRMKILELETAPDSGVPNKKLGQEGGKPMQPEILPDVKQGPPTNAPAKPVAVPQ